jgi:hypothetical protein
MENRVKRRKRHVVVSDDYLDGITALTVIKPEDFHEFVQAIDADILDAYDKAWDHLWATEKALRAAMGAAPEIRNRLYKSPESGSED